MSAKTGHHFLLPDARTHNQEISDGEEATSSASAGFAPKAWPTAAVLTICGLGRTVDYMLSKGSRDAVPLADISRDLDVALKCPREKCVSWTATQAADRTLSGRGPFISIQERRIPLKQLNPGNKWNFVVQCLAFLGVGGPPYSMGKLVSNVDIWPISS
ncbi:unnamed protein product [Musa hybrid cultivar]